MHEAFKFFMGPILEDIAQWLCKYICIIFASIHYLILAEYDVIAMLQYMMSIFEIFYLFVLYYSFS